MDYIIVIDQSTSSTKALLFDDHCQLVGRTSVDHKQYYPQTGWVEHDAEEIYQNTITAISQLTALPAALSASYSGPSVPGGFPAGSHVSLALTNQRETVVVWNRYTGRPISRALVWQDTRSAAECRRLLDQGYGLPVMERTGLLIDPNFPALGVKWLLDNVEGARLQAERGQLLMGTIDTWLMWKLTKGAVHATDTTNASRTMLFNIHTMEWDFQLLRLFTIPRSMMPEVKACDSIFGSTTCEGVFDQPIPIAGVLGDSHGALVGQMCFAQGQGKVTYGTGSSVMVNIGTEPLLPPDGLVTSVGFTAQGQTCYAFEGNIYSTGATLKWMADQLQLVGHPSDMEALATSVDSSDGVYIVPAFSGLGAPWWKSNVKGAVFGLTFATTKAHIVRAALESIAYQVKDLVDTMQSATASGLKQICADGGPTSNHFLMQLQADLLQTPVVCTQVDDASALGAAIMGGMAVGLWSSFDDVATFRKVTRTFQPQPDSHADAYAGWLEAVRQLTK
jgi:glycerol kinase